MEIVASHFDVFSLGEAIRRLREGALPPRAACVTFDDGYADNVTMALPILKEMQIPATFFIATGFLEGGRMWNDTVIESVRLFAEPALDLSRRGFGCFDASSEKMKNVLLGTLLPKIKYLPFEQRHQEVAYIEALVGKALPDHLMMSSEQVKKLHASGMEIGAHTVNHPILANIDIEEARTEMKEGKDYLEGLLGEPVRVFAYPNGKPERDYRPEHSILARELGFDAAVSTAWGVATPGTDFWQIPRFTPWDKEPVRFFLRLLNNYRKPVTGSDSSLNYQRRQS